MCAVFLLLGMGLIVASKPCLAQTPSNSNANHQVAVRLNKEGISFAKKGDYTSAIQRFRHACDLWPEFPDSQFNLAVTLEKVGQMDQAISAFRKAVRLRPDSAPMCLALGLALARNHDLDGAASELQHAVRLSRKILLPTTIWA